jgi:hypothetical protein
MIDRCTKPTHQSWERYGGRGIKVCKRWLVFTNFLADMGTRPPNKSLDRKKNDGNYKPGNVRWATRSEQQRNTRRNHLITFDGHTLCAAEWVVRLGIKRSTFMSRFERGWTVEQAMRGSKKRSRA